MDKPIEHYWHRRMADLKKALEGNNFEVFLAETPQKLRISFSRRSFPRLEQRA